MRISKVNACFGCTYFSESGFSAVEILKTKCRLPLNDKHVNHCMGVDID
jgi:hypothetical protein